MKKIFRIIPSIGMLVALLVSPGVVLAADADFKAHVQTNRPLESTLTLTNTTDRACQVAKTPIGTVAITEVIQNGESISPTLFDAAFDQSMPNFLKDRLQTLEP